ncbi:hypothetical protein ISF_02770 [Cordyceps fumosorosea ARSEF 2679]|uniref:DUF92 domain protein n=1 Tax=Cordyceps fumosorosea (strain ARSEF 2679) TaxID=1081104 RepID=A0A168B1T9_CORFA|nr:hypothetical protein ISF_02770 [Cordyceps fumosorosea ARSEF 2679]OAA69500.1 hypothetical protein ISF_02770 [Cordyceps fumosorosea ARSEF 2679]
MVETENLRAASAYINNQLLSRGLLRDGQTIDFAGHGKCEDASVTAGRIISVVNDLILRRDRDADHRETLSTTMRSLRAENIKQLHDITKLEEKNAEAQRKLEIATAAENAAKTQLKSAESAMRGLKEQLARTKALVAQTRTSCATEVRRRDRQIDTLKKQLSEAGRARGVRANPAITTITVTGNVDEEPSSPTKTGGMLMDEYSLRGESTVSLAKLSQNLSEENEAVLALMSQAMDQLREMSGLEDVKAEHTQSNQQQSLEDMSSELEGVMEHLRHILNNPSFVPIEEVVVREEEINRLKEGWVKMETRWKDAMLLIDGWRKRMAAGGSPIREDELKLGFRLGSVRLTGTTSAIGDSTLAPLSEEASDEEERAQHQDENIYDRSDNESDNYDEEEAAYDLEEPAYGGEMVNEAPIVVPAEEGHNDAVKQDPERSEELPQEAQEIPGQSPEAEDHAVDETSRESTPLPEPPQLSPLRNSSSAGNRGSQQVPDTVATRRKQPVGLSSSSLPAPTQRQRPAAGELHVQKRGLEQPGCWPTRIVTRANANPRPATRVTSLEEALLSKPAQAPEPSNKHPVEKELATKPEPKTQQEQGPKTELHETRLHKSTIRTTQRTTSRTSRLTPHKPFPKPAEPMPQQSPLTMSNIEAKLAASEADADRVRAKLLAVRSRSTTLKPADSLSEPRASHRSTRDDRPNLEAEKHTRPHRAVDRSDKRADDLENTDPVKVDSEPPTREPGDGHLKVQKRKRDTRISSKRSSRRRRQALRFWTPAKLHFQLLNSFTTASPGEAHTIQTPFQSRETPPPIIMKPVIAIPATLALIVFAAARRSLTPMGLVAATATAAAHAYHPWNMPFALLVAFFLAGTRVTKIKKDVKAKLTLSAAGASGAEGPRTHVQVLANSLVASILSILHARQLRQRAAAYADPNTDDPSGSMCYSYGGDLLVVGIIANYAAVAADTFSSELGILSTARPRLITSLGLRRVPPGTNGGVTPLGLAAGLFGSLLMVTVGFVFLPACGEAAASTLGGGAPWTLADRRAFLGFLVACGFAGTLLDSLLGALLQRSVRDVRSGKIVEGEGGTRAMVHATTTTTAAAGEGKESSAGSPPSSPTKGLPSRVVESGLDLLDNNDVNFLMAVTISVGAMYLTSLHWGIPVEDLTKL